MKIFEKANKESVLLWLSIFASLIYIFYCYYVFANARFPVDEGLVTGPGYAMLINKNWLPGHYLCGSLSLYLSKIGFIITEYFGISVNNGNVIYYNRIFFSLLQSLSYIFIYGAAYYFFDKNKRIALLTFLLAVFSFYPSTTLYYVYPDKLIFILANIIYFCAAYMYKNKDDPRIFYIFYPIYGVLIGLSTSVKYNGFIPIILFFFIHIHNKYYKNHLANFYFLLSLALIPSIFLAMNYTVFVDENNWTLFYKHFMSNVYHYRGAHLGLDTNNGYLYYLNVFLLSDYGWMGGLLFIMGCGQLIKAKRFRDLIFICLPFFSTCLFIGGYNIALARNVSASMPLISFGICATIHCAKSAVARKLTSLAIIVLIIVNAVLLMGYSHHDSSVKMAEKWIEQNIPAGSTIIWSIDGGGEPLYKLALTPDKYVLKNGKPFFSEEPQYFQPQSNDEYVVDVSFLYRFYYKTIDTPFLLEKKPIYQKRKEAHDNYVNTLHLVKSFPGGIEDMMEPNYFSYKTLIKNLFNKEFSFFQTINIYTKPSEPREN